MVDLGVTRGGEDNDIDVKKHCSDPDQQIRSWDTEKVLWINDELHAALIHLVYDPLT